MYLRAAKCRFAPLDRRYHHGEFHSVSQKEGVKRGVLAGLDRSHSKDYKVSYASDPLLVVHGKQVTTHEDIKTKLEGLDLWLKSFHKIEIPRKDEKGKMTYAPGFKSSTRDARRLGRFKQILNDNATHLSLSSDRDIEVVVQTVQGDCLGV